MGVYTEYWRKYCSVNIISRISSYVIIKLLNHFLCDSTFLLMFSYSLTGLVPDYVFQKIFESKKFEKFVYSFNIQEYDLKSYNPKHFFIFFLYESEF